MKKWLLLCVAAAMFSILVACGNTADKKSEDDAPIVVDESEIATGSLEIVASNWEFDKEVYAIRANEAVEISVSSIEGVHGIGIVGTDYGNIIDGKPQSVTITEPGTYTIRCSIPCGGGHRNMVAKLVVVE